MKRGAHEALPPANPQPPKRRPEGRGFTLAAIVTGCLRMSTRGLRRVPGREMLAAPSMKDTEKQRLLTPLEAGRKGVLSR